MEERPACDHVASTHYLSLLATIKDRYQLFKEPLVSTHRGALALYSAVPKTETLAELSG